MSKFLQQLLNDNGPLVAAGLGSLERATGMAGVDVRLIGDIINRGHWVMRELGLDPADTTPRELYLALQAYIRRSDDYELLLETDYVLLPIDGEVISFNLVDTIENSHYDLSLDQRCLTHGRRALQGELVQRYLAHERSHPEVIKQVAHDAGLDIWYSKVKHNHKQKEEADKMSDKPYMLAIGDIFTDAFIKLGDETAKIIKEGDVEWLAVPFGRKPPYERVDIVKSVGPSPNVAVSVARLGLESSLMAWVGGDETGEEAIEYLKEQNVGVEPMIVEEDKDTSYWYVLSYKADRTMLVKSEKYRYEWHEPARKPDWVYLSYLGVDSAQLHDDVLAYLEKNPDIKLAFQPGTFQFQWGAEKLAGIYRRSHIVLMNREEAMDVTGRPYDSIKNLADGLHELGPEIAVITDGSNGSYVSHEDRVLTIPNYPDPQPPIERTGAGDAFSSTFVAAIASGESVETALRWSPINSMNVVQQVGAQAGLLTKAEIEQYIADAPDWYQVSEFED